MEEKEQDKSILKNAVAFYNPKFLPVELADRLFESFQELDWKSRTYKSMPLKRQTTVYGDETIKAKAPSIWGEDAEINPWTKELLELKALVEEATGEKYNIALGNRYRSRKEFIAFHSDNEEYGSTKSIASISLGCERTFTFRSKDESNREEVELKLAHGSLLWMGENCQELYRHGMKKESVDKEGKFGGNRINITFRKFLY